ncbi:hypothetical protein BGW80DRAFT_1317249 [Lactifluus volemus]|nr:hypothetical protein BGW80DRAFT_1317249 [Lactifluus volemus]
MMTPITQARACRKYVDLIQGISGKCPNWNPLKRIEVGDFGQFDRETGQFICEGNIYRDEHLASLMKDYPPQVDEPEYEHRIDTNFTARMSTLPNFGDLSDIVYKSQWKFKDARAAFLVMYRARKISIPRAFLDITLTSGPREVRGKNIVTSVWWCPAFAMYMSNQTNEHVRIALRAPNAGSGQETGWYAEGNVGIYQFGSLPNEGYLPLFHLQNIRKRNPRPRRDGRPPDEKIWASTDVPWDELDDDGNEIPDAEGEWYIGEK